jgi:hypothetical protein
VKPIQWHAVEEREILKGFTSESENKALDRDGEAGLVSGKRVMCYCGFEIRREGKIGKFALYISHIHTC